MTRWLSQFTRNTHTFDAYTRNFGYACAYTNGRPQPITGRRGLIHSTEGSNLPDYQGGRVNPNFTIDPWRKKRYQHVPADIASRATMANNDKFVQIEIIGFCDLAYATKYGMQEFYLERMGADELAYIAESLAIIGASNGIPTTSGVTWEAYPKSAWADNTVRLSQAQLNSYVGWLGHQHAPKPDIHGDPGVWPHTMNLMAAMRGEHPTPPKPPTPGKLTVDGLLGPATIAAWQRQCGTTVDGIISPDGSQLVEWNQRWLNAHGVTDKNGHKLVVDGIGIYDNTAHETASSHTQEALQKHWGTTVDGVLSHPSQAVKELQRRLNKLQGK